MAQTYQNIGHITLMLLLLCGSAFFSGAETAFFNLTRRQITLLRKSKHKLHNLISKLLDRPKQLLSCLLFGNMTVNVLFFAASSVLTVRISEQIGSSAAAVIALATFAILVLFGEIVPKSVAFTNPRFFSELSALPAFLLLQVLAPVIFVIRILTIEPALRLLLGRAQGRQPISTAEFKFLIDQLRRRGLISADENKLLGEIIQLGFLKVRHVMRPRVDMIACSVKEPAEAALEKMRKNHLTKLPVYVDKIDNIVGLVYLRQLLLQSTTSLDKLVQPVHFVPEQKTVESLLEFFRKSGSDIAVVVDEYGGIAGAVCLEDIAEELLGPIEITLDIEPMEQIGPFEYRLAGSLSIHDWADAFGVDFEETRISTVGGLVTAILGKLPKPGDVAYLENLKFTVEAVKKHRIESLLLNLEKSRAND